MNKKRLFDIIANILKSQGYSIRSYLPETDLVVEKAGTMTCIQYGQTESDLRHFASAVHESHDALFISDRITGWMAFFVDDCNIRTWDRAELEMRIGKAILAEAEGTQYDFLEAVYQSSTPEQMIEQIETPEDLQEMLQLRSAPIHVNEKNAITIAKGFISDVKNIVIEFVPFWNYKYIVDGYHRYKTKMVHILSEDSGAINALNKEKHKHIKEVYDQVSVPCKNYEIRSAAVTKDDVAEQIMENAVESSTKTIAFRSTSGDTIITEHKTIKPGSKDIDLDVELVYLPVWEVEGTDQSIRINAYDGSAMTEPIGDDVEFL